MTEEETIVPPTTLESPKVHIVFLHNKLKKRNEDRYLIDLALALKDGGHKVTICTSEYNQNSFVLEETENNEEGDKINVVYSGWWLPNSLKFVKSIVMAFRVVMFPPKPRPHVVIMDINTIALFIISMLSSIKTVYLAHFSSLNNADMFTKFMKVTPDLLCAKTLGYANSIVVQSEGMADIFRRSFPNIRKELKIIHPCVDTGLWLEDSISLERIIPDIPKPNFLFVCFGSYRKRSNFRLVLDAFEDLLLIIPDKFKNNIHLVIAGHCSESYIDQKVYYNELIDYTKDKIFASQVTFLRQLPTLHKKTLIDESIGVLIPCKYEIFPDTALAVLRSGRAIIATNTGFAKEALKHRITGILVEPVSQMFAAAMYKLLTNPAIQIFLSDMGHDAYTKKYSFNIFSRKINGIVYRLTTKKEELL